jgi:hypothetical protein
MHAVRNWDEEVVKWLAVGMCLAMVGMAVMPVIVQADGCLVAAYALNKLNDKQFAIGSGAITAGSLIVTGLYTASVVSAGVAGWTIVGLGIAF